MPVAVAHAWGLVAAACARMQALPAIKLAVVVTDQAELRGNTNRT
jgi:hypothetical protein